GGLVTDAEVGAEVPGRPERAEGLVAAAVLDAVEELAEAAAVEDERAFAADDLHPERGQARVVRVDLDVAADRADAVGLAEGAVDPGLVREKVQRGPEVQAERCVAADEA